METPSPSMLEALSNFLKWGPSGLAGLMLVLVVIALSLRRLDATRERLLSKFMYVGGGCFALALLAGFFQSAHSLHFNVLPIDLGQKHSLPMPIITVNNTRLNLDPPRTYVARSEATANIDVSDAINFVQLYRNQLAGANEAARALVSKADEAIAKLRQAGPLLTNVCSGGANGYTPANALQVISLNNEVANQIAASKASLSSIAAQTLP